jgi:hypothetical protein
MSRIAGPVMFSLALSLASCGGPDRVAEPQGAAAPCEPADRLELRAEGQSFGTSCLAVPADRRIRGTLESLDIEPHNFALYQDEPGPTQEDLSPPNLLVRSDTTFAGEPTSFRIPRLSEGRYFFRCDFHPEMNGSLHAV